LAHSLLPPLSMPAPLSRLLACSLACSHVRSRSSHALYPVMKAILLTSMVPARCKQCRNCCNKVSEECRDFIHSILQIRFVPHHTLTHSSIDEISGCQSMIWGAGHYANPYVYMYTYIYTNICIYMYMQKQCYCLNNQVLRPAFVLCSIFLICVLHIPLPDYT